MHVREVSCNFIASGDDPISSSHLYTVRFVSNLDKDGKWGELQVAGIVKNGKEVTLLDYLKIPGLAMDIEELTALMGGL